MDYRQEVPEVPQRWTVEDFDEDDDRIPDCSEQTPEDADGSRKLG